MKEDFDMLINLDDKNIPEKIRKQLIKEIEEMERMENEQKESYSLPFDEGLIGLLYE
jgi:hypothetical protein